jgi:hypothetical protein
MSQRAPARMSLLCSIAASTGCGTDTALIPAEAELAALEPAPEVLRFAAALNDRARIVIRDDAAWASTWQEGLSATRFPPDPIPPAPVIDFDRYVLIAASMGEQPSGG